MTPSVLGLGDVPATELVPAVEEEPAVEEARVTQPENASTPGRAAPNEIDGENRVEQDGLQHEVQEGQTLYTIAGLYGVPVERIAAANNLVSPFQIAAGTVLFIPQTQ